MLHVINNQNFFSKILFKIILTVFIAHILALFILCSPKISKVKKTKIVVHSSVMKKPIISKVIKTPIKKYLKTIPKNKKTVKTIKAKNSFIKDIEKCFQNLQSKKNSTKINTASLSVPKKIKKLEIQTNAQESILQDTYETTLIQFLQKNLELPNFGTVKIKLTINNNGEIKDLTILQAKNDENVQYLKNQLHSLIYPCFNCNEGKIKNYIINFNNLK